jgi:transcriptional regulator with XRE-family HTH domain
MDDVELNRIDTAVGSRIRRRRTALRLSQTTLGQMAGVTFQQVQKYENGTNRVSASRLVMIGRALGVSTAYFFEDVEPTAGIGRMPRPATRRRSIWSWLTGPCPIGCVPMSMR